MNKPKSSQYIKVESMWKNNFTENECFDVLPQFLKSFQDLEDEDKAIFVYENPFFLKFVENLEKITKQQNKSLKRKL
jgi:hypothetical protein